MKGRRGILWGVYLILAAVVIIALQLGSFVALGFWSIAASVLLVAILIESLITLNFTGIMLPLGVLYIIFQGPLGWVYISPWVLIISSVLAGIGLQMLIRRTPKWRHHTGFNHVDGHWGARPAMDVQESGDDGHPHYRVSFGTISKYLHTDCLESGQFYASFGAMEVYFDQVQLSPDGAQIFIDCSFGSIKLYIPREWQIANHVTTTLGAVEDTHRRHVPDEIAPVLTLTGNVQFGSLEIAYI